MIDMSIDVREQGRSAFSTFGVECAERRNTMNTFEGHSPPRHCACFTLVFMRFYLINFRTQRAAHVASISQV